MTDEAVSVSEFVSVLNQTLEYAYPSVLIVGEVANYRVSKNRWVYFDLKDEYASVKFFGTVYQLPGPLEDGLLLQVRGLPRLHQQFGFSVTVQFMQPVGEGSLKKAATLLEAQLTKEGIFDPIRKRSLPYPPHRVGLITSSESAAYKDFVKILNDRWAGLEITVADVQVQGEQAPGQIVRAIEYLNIHESALDIIVITRGGGSADDLGAFNTEQVVRAVAGSRIPTLVAIGHEVDISLAELAADQRASTPSNAAELLVPDKKSELPMLVERRLQLGRSLEQLHASRKAILHQAKEQLELSVKEYIAQTARALVDARRLLDALGPHSVLQRGYAIVRASNSVVRSKHDVQPGESLTIELHDGTIISKVQ